MVGTENQIKTTFFRHKKLFSVWFYNRKHHFVIDFAFILLEERLKSYFLVFFCDPPNKIPAKLNKIYHPPNLIKLVIWSTAKISTRHNKYS